MTNTPAVKVSDTVLYAMPDESRQPGATRPAIVVDVPDEAAGVVSLIVLIDGRNDDPANPPVTSHWRPGVAYGEQGEPGTWRPLAPNGAAQELAQLQAENARLRADAAALARDVAPEAPAPGESSAVAGTATPPDGSGQ